MTLDLRPEIADGLNTIASAHGLSVEDYLGELVHRELPTIGQQSQPEGGVTIEDGLPVYRSSQPLPPHFLDTAIERSREERSRHILGDRS